MRHATILVAIHAFVPLARVTAQEPPPVKSVPRCGSLPPTLASANKQEALWPSVLTRWSWLWRTQP